MRRYEVAAAVLALGLCARAGAQGASSDPTLWGYVTAVQADGGFSVAGVPIVLTPETKVFTLKGKEKAAAAPTGLGAPYLGESIKIWGRFDRKTKVITAQYLHFWPPAPMKVAGKAMIDAATPGGDTPDVERAVRADGYRLTLNATTKMHWNEPLASLKDVGTNQWITYTGTQGVDGVVTVDEAEVWQNRVDPDEARMKKKGDFDPAAVSADKKQSGVARETFGIDPKKLPAHQDPELQAKVQRIGDRLVPAYQKALPTTDPTKINFRFQVVDSDQLREGWGMESGVVQVPYLALVRLTTEDEMAALLADHVASVIEKQALMNAPANFRLKTAHWASTAGSVAAEMLVPGLGVATGLISGAITGNVASHIETLAAQQSGRVSLCLLHDAGYKVAEAPVMWWLLAPKKPKPVAEVDLPAKASDLYGVLGTTWRGRAE